MAGKVFFYNPFFAFFFFATANLLISYFDLPASVQIGIALIGFGFPLVSFWLGEEAQDGEIREAIWKRELFPKLWKWTWLILGLLAVLPRFYHLRTFSLWPFTDEGYFSFYSINLFEKGTYQIFFGCSQHPLFFNWALALFFKFFKPSLFSLWGFPALFSVFSAWLGFWAARNYFSKSFALFCALLMSFSFWPVYSGRFCMPLVALLTWQLLCLALAIAYLKSEKPGCRRFFAVLLGFGTGFGFYVAIAWPCVVVSIFLLAGFVCWHHGDWIEKTGFFGVTLLLFVIFSSLSLHERNGEYVRALWGFYPGMDWGQQLKDFFTHIQALFWGVSWRRLYGPVWGGLLNPVMGALFFVGAMELMKALRKPFARWLFISFGIALLPALIAKGYDSFRILAALPLTVLFCAIGLQAFLTRVGQRKRILVVLAVLGLSMGLDYYHLFNRFTHYWGTPGNAWNFGKEYELWKSYELLKRTAADIGPGALLFDLRTHLDDVTPVVAAYSFDATHNPDFSFADAKWVAVLVDANYLPFLSKRFPEGKYYWLCPKAPYGKWALGVIPVLPANQEALGKWFILNQEMRAVTAQIIDAMPGAPRTPILEKIYRLREKAEGDPFLLSVYWEKIFDNRLLDRDAPGCLEAARKCVTEGYALPQMYNEQGVILVQMGRYQEAKKAFQEAQRADRLHLTPALGNLNALQSVAK